MDTSVDTGAIKSVYANVGDMVQLGYNPVPLRRLHRSGVGGKNVGVVTRIIGKDIAVVMWPGGHIEHEWLSELRVV